MMISMESQWSRRNANGEFFYRKPNLWLVKCTRTRKWKIQAIWQIIFMLITAFMCKIRLFRCACLMVFCISGSEIAEWMYLILWISLHFSVFPIAAGNCAYRAFSSVLVSADMCVCTFSFHELFSTKICALNSFRRCDKNGGGSGSIEWRLNRVCRCRQLHCTRIVHRLHALMCDAPLFSRTDYQHKKCLLNIATIKHNRFSVNYCANATRENISLQQIPFPHAFKSHHNFRVCCCRTEIFFFGS